MKFDAEVGNRPPAPRRSGDAEHMRQIARARGDDVVQEGTHESGAVLRWTFTDITRNSFHWLGERRNDGGVRWRLQVDIHARRVPA